MSQTIVALILTSSSDVHLKGSSPMGTAFCYCNRFW